MSFPIPLPVPLGTLPMHLQRMGCTGAFHIENPPAAAAGAWPHPITSSAATSSVAGTVRPAVSPS